MIARTIVDPTVSPTTDLYNTVKQIINVDAEKVHLHPSDCKRVIHALRYFIQDVNKQKLTELLIRSRL